MMDLVQIKSPIILNDTEKSWRIWAKLAPQRNRIQTECKNAQDARVSHHVAYGE